MTAAAVNMLSNLTEIVTHGARDEGCPCRGDFGLVTADDYVLNLVGLCISSRSRE